ncbi:hypothetical protein AB0K51_32770 [Kitasatospora sp. NPDC049285]|uniref:hypothetical protein n=1 Tax=Kitasatospora sp. NPDC049285 TaxID=3157096 RepID=UPI003435F7D3
MRPPRPTRGLLSLAVLLSGADSAQWIDALATGPGTRRTVVVLEPDVLALSPAYCGGTTAQQRDRLAQIGAAVDRLERQPGALASS